jgi:hypothetical protein
MLGAATATDGTETAQQADTPRDRQHTQGVFVQHGERASLLDGRRGLW